MQPVDPRFSALKPKLDELLRELCPNGFRVIMLVLEPDPERPKESRIHMVSDIHNDEQIAALLHSIGMRLAGPVPGEAPGIVH
jgi:hypothetical protein